MESHQEYKEYASVFYLKKGIKLKILITLVGMTFAQKNGVWRYDHTSQFGKVGLPS
jgi:hypothetical protein